MSVDRNPVRTRFSEPAQIGPRDHPASRTMDTGSFPEVKRLGRGVNHSPQSGVGVKERVELHLYFPLCLHGKLMGEICFNNSVYFRYSNIIIILKMYAKNCGLEPLGHWHAYSWFPLCCHVRLRTSWRADAWPKVFYRMSQGFMDLELILIIRI